MHLAGALCGASPRVPGAYTCTPVVLQNDDVRQVQAGRGLGNHVVMGHHAGKTVAGSSRIWGIKDTGSLSSSVWQFQEVQEVIRVLGVRVECGGGGGARNMDMKGQKSSVMLPWREKGMMCVETPSGTLQSVYLSSSRVLHAALIFWLRVVRLDVLGTRACFGLTAVAEDEDVAVEGEVKGSGSGSGVLLCWPPPPLARKAMRPDRPCRPTRRERRRQSARDRVASWVVGSSGK